MTPLFLALTLLGSPAALAAPAISLPEAERAFNEGHFPTSLNALVGAYEGTCVAEGNWREDRVNMAFGFFELSRGWAYAGANLHHTISAEQIVNPAFWTFFQAGLVGTESRRLNGAILYQPNSPALSQREGESFSVYLLQATEPKPQDFTYRTEYRLSPTGALVTRVSGAVTQPFYCFWYEKFVSREEVPAAFRGPKE